MMLCVGQRVYVTPEKRFAKVYRLEKTGEQYEVELICEDNNTAICYILNGEEIQRRLKPVPTVEVSFDYMPTETIRGFTKLAEGEIILDDPENGYTEVRIPAPGHFERNVYIAFYEDHPQSASRYWSDFFGKTGDPVFEDAERGFRIFDESGNNHYYVVLTDEPPSAELTYELVQLCLNLARRQES